MKAEEIDEKIAELLDFTHAEEDFGDPILEGYKETIITLSKQLARYTEKENWSEARGCIAKIVDFTHRAEERAAQ